MSVKIESGSLVVRDNETGIRTRVIKTGRSCEGCVGDHSRTSCPALPRCVSPNGTTFVHLEILPDEPKK